MHKAAICAWYCDRREESISRLRVSRSIGYFLEPLIVLALFGKRPLEIKLIGITNDLKDPSVDTFQSTTLPILQRFEVSQDLRLKIENRGVAPEGGGEILLNVPILQDSLKAVNWIEEGMVKEISGVTFSNRVSRDFENSMIYSARGIFNHLLPHVHIHKAGSRSGKSAGYGISLYAKTTSGCRLSANTTISYSREGDFEIVNDDDDDDDEKKDLNRRPEDVGEQIAYLLLKEIEQGGVVDSSHQGLLFILCALCPQDVCKVRVGKISPYGIETLRHIHDFLGVKFHMNFDPSTGTVILECLGCGLKNLSRKVS